MKAAFCQLMKTCGLPIYSIKSFQQTAKLHNKNIIPGPGWADMNGKKYTTYMYLQW